MRARACGRLATNAVNAPRMATAIPVPASSGEEPAATGASGAGVVGAVGAAASPEWTRVTSSTSEPSAALTLRTRSASPLTSTTE